MRNSIVLVILISLLALSGCSSVFDHHGYVVSSEDFDQNSFYTGERYGSKNFPAPGGKIFVTAKPFESRILWWGPIIPLVPELLWAKPDTTYTAESGYVVLQFDVMAEDIVRVDWNKLRVATVDGTPLKTRPAEDFFQIMALFKKGAAHHAVRCSLEGTDEPHPDLSVDLPLIHTNAQFFKLNPVILSVQQGKHFTIGFK